jgi:RHS repeat-associated protein
MEYSSELHDAQVIVPHNDWRGTYDRGTTVVGSCVVYSTNGTQLAPPPDSTPTHPDQYGGVAGGGTYAGTKEHCIDVDWPAAYTWSARQYRRGYSGPDSWMGSLIFESRDASGLYYRRNRYYDSEKGRFTQEDPIGLAGGVNVYGFAEGDPLAFCDPYGLLESACCPQWLVDASAGFGDAVSFGLTDRIREAMGTNEVVNKRSGAYLGGTAAGIVVGTIATSGLGTEAEVANGAERMAAVRAVGRAGEEAAGITKNSTRIASVTRPGTYRIPDELTSGVISEVKNVARQGLTSQLRDFIAHAQANGLRFDLYVRRTTQLSGPLQDAVRQGLVNLRYLP